jgi:hypothetical protein
MRLTAALTFIAFLFVCTSVLARQVAPIGMPQPARKRPLHFLADEHGDLWICGATYKSSVSTAGAQYIPYLGSDAPAPLLRLLGGAADIGAEGCRHPQRLHRLADRMKRDHAGIEAEMVFARRNPTRSNAIRAAILKRLDVLETRKRNE